MRGCARWSRSDRSVQDSLHLALLLIASIATQAAAQNGCPKGDTRFYSHNDYLSARPLVDALEKGYVGVEADVVLVDGELRLGHDRKQASKGRRFEDTYLARLDSVAGRCGRVIPMRPFLLTVEIKEESAETFAAVASVLRKYEGLVTTWVNVVQVGWHPAARDWPGGVLLEGQQFKITTADSAEIAHQARGRDDGTRLISLDYGKTAGRWWRTASGRRRWLDAIRLARAHFPTAMVRAYNVPADTAVYQRLQAVGAMVIGIKPRQD